MIPSSSAFLEQDFSVVGQPDYTYKMNIDDNRIIAYTDGKNALIQAIYKILSTEKYQYAMYSWNYGIELLDLFGEPVSYVCPELESRISEALTQDDRINSVDNFKFDISQKGVVHAAFTAHTIFGDIDAEKAVNF